MTIRGAERAADSRFVASVIDGGFDAAGTVIRPASAHWHLVFIRDRLGLRGRGHRVVLAGPRSAPGRLDYPGGLDAVWVRFALGAHLAGVSASDLVDQEIDLCDGSAFFSLAGSRFQVPGADDMEALAADLHRCGVMAYAPVLELRCF